MTDENLSKQVCKIFSQPLPYELSFGAAVDKGETDCHTVVRDGSQ